MSRRPTPTSALENAKREAKRWLKALRDGVDEARARLERAISDAPAVPIAAPRAARARARARLRRLERTQGSVDRQRA